MQVFCAVNKTTKKRWTCDNENWMSLLYKVSWVKTKWKTVNLLFVSNKLDETYKLLLQSTVLWITNLVCITALPEWNLHFEIHRLILGLSPYVTGNFKGLFTNEVTPKASMSSNKVFSDIWQLVECRDDKELSCKCRLKKSPSLFPYLTYPLTSRQWKCSSLLQKMISCMSPYISVNCR